MLCNKHEYAVGKRHEKQPATKNEPFDSDLAKDFIAFILLHAIERMNKRSTASGRERSAAGVRMLVSRVRSHLFSFCLKKIIFFLMC